MPLLAKLKQALDAAKISYEVYNHPTAFTAQEIAATQHIPGKDMAKVVMLMVDDSLVMAVVPASRKIAVNRARISLGAETIRLATEEEFAAAFPDCQIGAMPPFGNLFGLPVYIDPLLEEDESIYFNAGNHQQTVRVAYRDFKRMVQPKVVGLAAGIDRKAA